jgi:SAM-dependent methyltransferase
MSAGYELVGSWASLDDLINAHDGRALRLDLGCGYAKPDGFIGLDNLIGERAQIRDERHGPDILIDLNQAPLPFADGSCVEVRASHFLEHSILDHIFDETYRVLAPSGRFVFAVPYANSAEGLYPGHNIFLTEKFFERNLNFQSKFAIAHVSYDPTEEYENLPWLIRKALPFDRARLFLFNVCWQMTIEARPRK